jgi:glutamine amidotransferase
MMTIIDYGLGNIQAFINVYRRMQVPIRIARSIQDLEGASRLILPGVGTFDHAMTLLDASGMRSALDRMVLDERIPILGVCVGMQILADSSEEGTLGGLGWVPARVIDFSSNPAFPSLPKPHMGWNDVKPPQSSQLFAGLDNEARFYFLHSFFFEGRDNSSIVAQTSYGIDFVCAIERGNIFGVQFHPEKSHRWGSRLLKNFTEAH